MSVRMAGVAGVAGVAGAAVVGAGVVVATHPAGQAVPTPVEMLAAQDITLDLVRHGQDEPNISGHDHIATLPPGASLTALGEQQADDVARAIHTEFGNGVDGIYASELVRTQETAQPLADLLGQTIQVLPGLNEINAGILEGLPTNGFSIAAYVTPTLLWALGLYFVPEWFSTVDLNGMAFEDRFNGAVQTIYDNSVSRPGATDVDVAFSHEAAIAAWALMNAKNPDIAMVLHDLVRAHHTLPNAGQVVLQGNPTDGWTLISWDGQPVPAASPGTELFVDLRGLITAPQMAAWHIWEAVTGGDPAAILPAVHTGFEEVSAALGWLS